MHGPLNVKLFDVYLIIIHWPQGGRPWVIGASGHWWGQIEQLPGIGPVLRIG